MSFSATKMRAVVLPSHVTCCSRDCCTLGASFSLMGMWWLRKIAETKKLYFTVACACCHIQKLVILSVRKFTVSKATTLLIPYCTEKQLKWKLKIITYRRNALSNNLYDQFFFNLIKFGFWVPYKVGISLVLYAFVAVELVALILRVFRSLVDF